MSRSMIRSFNAYAIGLTAIALLVVIPTAAHAGYPDGMNRYAAYHVMHGGVDPTGLWKIDRAGGRKASAEAEVGDSANTLADKVGLRRGEYRQWITMTKVRLTSGSTVSLSSLGRSDEICPGEVVEVPNTIYALWLGDLADSITTDYAQQVADLGREGFNVEAVSGVGSKRSHVAPRVLTGVGFRGALRASSASRELQGIFVEGHGNPWDFYNSNRRFMVSYAQVDRQLRYRLGTTILNVCNGGWRAVDNPVIRPPSRWSISDQIYYQMYGDRYVPGPPPSTLPVGGRDLGSNSGEHVFYGLRRGLNPLTQNADIPSLFPRDYQGTK